MKKLYLFALLVFNAATGHCQTTFNTRDSIDINNITASVLVHGDMWWQPENYANRCRYPAHAATNINFVSALWMSGYDAGDNLHIASQTYRQNGNDWWPGPLDATGSVTWAASQSWAKIWKLNRTDIQIFQANAVHTVANTPQAILTWPAKGNAYAAGNTGTPFTITEDMAPFVDLNGNGAYEPLLGEYPDVPGDQAAWWVFSDSGSTHNESKGRAMGVEIHAMAYAYKRGTAIDNVIYYDYTMVNKSTNNYHNCRLAQWDDVDLGYWQDDYIGFDSAWRMAIAYNAYDDEGAVGGYPAESYGHKPPQMGLTMVALPGDAGSSYVPAGSFIFFSNDFSKIGNPSTAKEYDNYMRAKTRVGDPLDSFKYNWMPSTCPATSQRYVYPGDPSDNTSWNECSCGIVPGDRRFVLSSNDFTLNAGSSAHAVIALVVASPTRGCDSGTNFNAIRDMADTAWHVYHNPLPPKVGTDNILLPAAGISVYPNPACTKVIVDRGSARLGNATIVVYNMLGQQVPVPTAKGTNKYELDISRLPAGLYSVLCRDETGQATARFIKE